MFDQRAAAAAVITHRQRVIAARGRSAQAAGLAWRAIMPATRPGDQQLAGLERQWLDVVQPTIDSAVAITAAESALYVAAIAAAAGTQVSATTDTSEAIGLASTRVAITAAIVTLHARLALGVEWAQARVSGEASARRAATTTVVKVADRTANLQAKRSGKFRGWRRITSANPCGACLAGATREVRDIDEPIGFHLGCRCTRLFVPDRVVDSELAWLPTGQQLFERLDAAQQDALFHGRGGKAKADLIRSGKVPLDALIRTSHGQAAEQTLDELEAIARANG